MGRPFLISFLIIIASNFCSGQVDHKKAFQQTLQRAEIGKEISSDKTKGNNYDSLVLVYLGDIRTTKGQHLKIITSRWYWGASKRGTSRIIVFNQKNQYLGDYYLTTTYDVPDRIEDNSLVFINDEESSCTPNLVTKVSFKKGIPKSFFLKCKDNLGDIYTFAQNL